MNKYLKFFVSLLGPAWAAYQAAQPSGSHWSVTVAGAIGSILVYLVPNIEKDLGVKPPQNVDWQNVQITRSQPVPAPQPPPQAPQQVPPQGGTW